MCGFNYAGELVVITSTPLQIVIGIIQIQNFAITSKQARTSGFIEETPQ